MVAETSTVHTIPRPSGPPASPAPLTRIRTGLDRLFALDFTRRPQAIVLALLFVLSRASQLNLGYGADADAWRVAITGHWFWEHGQFYPSRLPGYPLHELITTLIIGGGWLATNTATMLVALAGVFIFAAIVKRLAIEPKGLLTLTYAFTPLLWNASTVTMDYMWGLTFTLGAYLLLIRRQYLLAGVVLGIAAGFRPVSIAFAGPFLLVVVRGRDFGGAARLLGGALGTAAAVFAPIWWRYGTRFLDFADWRPPWGETARALGVEALGLMPAVTLGILLLLSLPRLRLVPGWVRRDGHFAAQLAATLMIAAVFVRLPLEEGYLIPAAPFALLVVARLFRRPLLVTACVVVVLGAFLDIHTASSEGWRSPAALLYLRPEKGRVLVDRALRQQRMQVADETWTSALPDNAVVTMGYYYPIFAEMYHDRTELRFREDFDPRVIGPLTDITEAVDQRNRVFVWLLTEGQVREYRRRGYRTFTMDYRSTERLTLEETLNPALERYGPR